VGKYTTCLLATLCNPSNDIRGSREEGLHDVLICTFLRLAPPKAKLQGLVGLGCSAVQPQDLHSFLFSLRLLCFFPSTQYQLPRLCRFRCRIDRLPIQMNVKHFKGLSKQPLIFSSSKTVGRDSPTISLRKPSARQDGRGGKGLRMRW